MNEELTVKQVSMIIGGLAGSMSNLASIETIRAALADVQGNDAFWEGMRKMRDEVVAGAMKISRE